MANGRPGCSGLSCEGVEPPPSSLGARGSRRQQGTVRWGNEAAQPSPALSLVSRSFTLYLTGIFLAPAGVSCLCPCPPGRRTERSLPLYSHLFVACPFVLPSSSLLGAEQSQIMPALLLCDILKISRGKKYTLAEIFWITFHVWLIWGKKKCPT